MRFEILNYFWISFNSAVNLYHFYKYTSLLVEERSHQKKLEYVTGILKFTLTWKKNS